MLQVLSSKPRTFDLIHCTENVIDGQVIQWKENEFGSYLGISDGSAPFGIVWEKKVILDRCVIKTDQFDKTQKYPLNSTIYCNEFGQLTTEYLFQALGMVVGQVPSEANPYLTVLWF